MNYQEFLKSKIDLAKDSGFDIKIGDMQFKDGTVLKPHQRDITEWAIRGGRRAIFASWGLGKTIMQLLISKTIVEREGGKSLIVCPLGVKQEFSRDTSEKLGVEIDYARTLGEAKSSSKSIIITNYERIRDGDIDPTFFTCACLDEAAVLRGYGTKTYQTFLPKFKNVKYRFVATATPSPNRFKELIHYAGYLGIMDTGQALTRFFKRDSSKAGNLQLYPNREEEFWLWVSSWAVFVTKPSDLGYDDTGYDLPPLNVVYHKISVDHASAGFDKDGQGKIFRDAAIGLQDASREKRDSIETRCAKAIEIVKSCDRHFILWHHRERERAVLKKLLPEMAEIYGTLDIETREQRTIDFSNGKIKYLGSKPEVSGSGCNFQRYCADMVFVGIDYQFNDFIQAIMRCYRFLQSKPVTVHIIYTESEEQIMQVLKQKWEQHERMVQKMISIIKKYGLAITGKEEKLTRTFQSTRTEKKGDLFTAVLNDNVLEMERIADNSIDMICTSVPFSNHYEYSASYNDFGHNQSNDRFFKQMDFLTPHLLRALRPGRVAAIHVKDRVLFGNATGTGMPTIDPFHVYCIEHYRKHGFQYFGMITIVTDVVRENNQTYRLGWTEQCKDGSKMGVGCPEYVLLFRKLPSDTTTAYADIPVTKTKDEYTRAQWQIDASAFWRSSGNRAIAYEDMKDIPVETLQQIFREWSRRNLYDYEKHVELAKALDEKGSLPATFQVTGVGSHSEDVWDDVNRMLTLNTEQARKDLEFHICPLQFDIVDRLINRYSNKGDLILDPFAGLMTVPYRAILAGRKGYGIELTPQSWQDGIWYCEQAENQVSAPTLFDLDEAMTGCE